MNKKIILFIMLCVFIIPFVFSIPPVQTTAVVSDNYLLIAYPKIENLKFNGEVQFNFHVMNSTGHLLDNTTTECEFHVYNGKGFHIIESKLLFNGDEDFYYNLSTNLLELNKKYSYIVNCESTNGQAGFISTLFNINTTGKEEQNNLYTILILYILIIAFYVFFGFVSYRNTKNDTASTGYWFSFFFNAMAVMMLLNAIFTVRVYQLAGDINIILNVTWIVNSIVLFFGGLIIMLRNQIQLSSMNPDDQKWNKEKW